MTRTDTTIIKQWFILNPSLVFMCRISTALKNNHTPTQYIWPTHKAYCNRWRQWYGKPAFFKPCWASPSRVTEKCLRSMYSDMFDWPDRNLLIRRKRRSTLRGPSKESEKMHSGVRLRKSTEKKHSSSVWWRTTPCAPHVRLYKYYKQVSLIATCVR